ncbi:ATP synthase subunit [Candidatus Epulonipiscium fishelsonii]|uniref:ATP synthase subunit n=1 Tax=Candidatus Epulonipiscium fishelsonii TaxID=77094 RepID=A0ACC8XEL7_9FIRM|nr:ATP synthase subunit [Epulopiscium sp. SCG-B11WGA-EpuloA1]ONI43933.1 ATP synthase subunit [Epulopiscium sp. SCG-B05WGA-EpuloA1]
MKKRKNWISALSLVSQLGISMSIPIFGCTFLGIFLDNVTGKSPLWLVIFILLGVGAAFRNMFHIILHEAKKGDYHE